MNIEDVKAQMFVRFVDKNKIRFYYDTLTNKYRVKSILPSGRIYLEAFEESDGSPVDVGYCDAVDVEEINDNMKEYSEDSKQPMGDDVFYRFITKASAGVYANWVDVVSRFKWLSAKELRDLEIVLRDFFSAKR